MKKNALLSFFPFQALLCLAPKSSEASFAISISSSSLAQGQTSIRAKTTFLDVWLAMIDDKEAGKPSSFHSSLLSSSCPLVNLSTTSLLPNSPLHSSDSCPASSSREVKTRVPASAGKG